MNQAFANYLNLAEILRSDLLEMVEKEKGHETWKRNYIRVVAALIEGESFCFRQMAAVGLEFDVSSLTQNEKKALQSSVGFSATDQIKLVLRAAYKMFNLGVLPDFGGEDWLKATEMFDKRHRLMHPKIPADLRITDEEWPRLYEGATWLLEQHFKVTGLLYSKYVKKVS